MNESHTTKPIDGRLETVAAHSASTGPDVASSVDGASTKRDFADYVSERLGRARAIVLGVLVGAVVVINTITSGVEAVTRYH
jgi:hypothetical protein